MVSNMEFIIVIFVLLFVIAGTIGLTVWVARDASHRGANGAIWGMLVFFTGLIGLSLYLVFRPQNPVVSAPSRPASTIPCSNSAVNRATAPTPSSIPVAGCFFGFLAVLILALAAVVGVPFSIKKIEQNRAEVAFETRIREERYAEQKKIEERNQKIFEAERARQIEEKLASETRQRQQREEVEKRLYAIRNVPRLFPTLARSAEEADPSAWIDEGTGCGFFLPKNNETPTFVVDKRTGFRAGDVVRFDLVFMPSSEKVRHEEYVNRTIETDGLTAVWVKIDPSYRPPCEPTRNTNIDMSYYCVIAKAFLNGEPVDVATGKFLNDGRTCFTQWFIECRDCMVPPVGRKKVSFISQ